MRRTSRYFLAVVVLAFIASLAYFGATQDRSNITAVATVNGEEISAVTYDRAYRATVEQYRQILRDRFNDELMRSLRLPDQVIDRLVTDRLLTQRAAAEGIGVSDGELSGEIVKIGAFQKDGQFSRDQYVRALSRAGLTPPAFEHDLRAQLLQRKLQGLVTDGVRVSEAEARQYWEGRRARVRAAYLVVGPEAFLAGAEAGDAEIEAYYKDHPAEFTRPERRRVLAALLPAAAVPAPTVGDADVEAAYQERRAEFEQPERRKVAHILVRVPTVGGSAAEEGAKAKAEAALAQIKGGADFARVAREVSQDDATASRGGELGLVARGELMPPFEQVAFELKRGEVGGPVRTGYGYHVVKVLDVLPTSKKELREVAPTIRAGLAAEGQLRLLRQKAEEAHERLLAAPDFATEARQRGLTVREIGPLARPDAVEGIGRVAEATTAIFALPPGGVSAPVKVPEGYVVFRLLEKEEPKVLPLAEVRPQAVQAVRRQKAQEAAQAKAKQLADALRAGEDPRSLAKRGDGVGVGETGPFSRTEPMADKEVAPAIGALALGLPEGGVGGPVAGPKGLYVVKVVGRERPNPAEFEAARRETERQLLEQKRGQTWQAWLAGLREGAKIEVNRKVLPQP
ncbi:MAG: peptidyl-prolyl cis-trans isomerase [Candidatus Rokubacteria bacterium]|nr:peptidyl-prolyl cis-trans isomerase [Candidatus Rokubacteria bacterium]